MRAEAGCLIGTYLEEGAVCEVGLLCYLRLLRLLFASICVICYLRLPLNFVAAYLLLVG